MDATLKVDGKLLGRLGLAKVAKEIIERLNDVRPAWDAVRALIFLQEEEVFDAQGEVEGFMAWDPLGPTRYAQWKQEFFPGKPILQLSGRMKNQLTGRTGDHYEARTPTTLCIGSNYPVAGSSGQRSNWMTEGIGEAVLARRWSLDADREDVAGIQVIGTIFNDAGTWRPVPPRSPIRITQSYADLFGDVLAWFAATGVVPDIRGPV